MTVLADGQYALDGLVFGRGTQIQVAETALDPGDPATQDSALIGADGRQFGVDTEPGWTITFTGQVYVPEDPAGALSVYGALAAAWSATDVRMIPRAVSALELRYPGSGAARITWGRARKLAPTLGMVRHGLIPYVGTFDTAGPLFYAGDEQQAHLGVLWSDPGGGMSLPASLPAALATSPGPRSDIAVNPGPDATWPTVTFGGPVVNPSLTYVETGRSVGLTGSLASGEQVTVDTRPWARSVTNPDGGSYAGRLTGDRLADLALPAGQVTLAFRGQDSTGQASCVFAWRPATRILGGTVTFL